MAVTGILRFVAILNAAVWCGSAVFLLVGLPAVFSPDLKRLLTDAGVGFAAERIVARYFLLQYCCAGIAITLLVADSLYSGRRVSRAAMALVVALLAIAFAGGFIAQPRMTALHRDKYFGRSPEIRAAAGQQFAVWHGTSEAVNLIAVVGLVIFLWKVSALPEPPRAPFFRKIGG